MNISETEDITFIFYILLIVGGIEVLLFIYLYPKAKRTYQWHCIKGTMCYMRVEKTDSSTADDARISYKLDTLYKYEVDEIKYSSKRIFIGDFILSNNSEALKRKIIKHTKKSQIDVYYNPLKPAESVLEPGVNKAIYKNIVIGVSFIILSIILGIYSV